MILEACVGNLLEAQKAESFGAHQIELCDRLDLDGTSPPLNLIEKVSNSINIPVKVIVNPNPYDYIYTTTDIKRILAYVKKLNKLKIAGIVFGPMTNKGIPDLDSIKVVSESTSLPITFHKAIDASSNILKSTEMLTQQGIIKFILSSGGEKTAVDGLEQLLKMKNLVKKTPVSLIAGGTITRKNLANLHQQLQLTYYHGKKIVGDLNDLD